MSKATNRRALAACIVITLLYVSVAFRLPEKLSMRRIAEKQSHPVREMNIHGSNTQQESLASPKDFLSPAASDVGSPPSPPEHSVSSTQSNSGERSATPKVPNKVNGSTPVITAGTASIEPRILITVPITCYAIREGWIDRDSLIVSTKNGQHTLWSKPLDILRRQDEEGIRQMYKVIGKGRLGEFFRREGIETAKGLEPEEIMLGKGYLIDKRRLLGLYNQHVSDACGDLFPLVLANVGVIKGRQGFQLVSAQEAAKMRAERQEAEWRMPNLTGLPLKIAIGKLALHTSNIKVHGSGFVVEQWPKPFERLKGDHECSIHGRLYSE